MKQSVGIPRHNSILLSRDDSLIAVSELTIHQMFQLGLRAPFVGLELDARYVYVFNLLKVFFHNVRRF